MGFLGVYKAIYDYAPQAEGELAITEGELVYVLEKSEDDDWWKAKKKADGEEDEEPEGLIPNNYVEEAQPESHARALYEYTRQTDEELSFPEDANLAVYDSSDPDWILVGLDGEFGFVPANYIEVGEGDAEEEEPPAAPAAPALPSRPTAAAVASPPLPPRDVPSAPASPASPAGPAAALAGVLAGRSAGRASTPPPVSLPPRPTYASDEASEDEARSPPLPTRPRAQSAAYSPEPQHSMPSPPLPQRTATRDYDDHDAPYPSPGLSPGGFRLYNINEMVSVMGKRKKMPTTLGINLKTGMILVAPERAQDGPSQEWSADKMTHYSREGKHVFVELVRPSKSVDFHAGAKDTAEEIVSALGELAGAVKAVGLKEVIMAGSGHEQKKGVVVYDFMAQGDDEVTVAVGDEVIVIDDLKSEEWWQVRRLKNGKEGVVPSSYIEITGTISAPVSSSRAGINAGKSTVEQNRLEEERLTKEAIKAAMKDDGRRNNEVGPGMRLPDRKSSLSAGSVSNDARPQRSSKRENGRAEGSSSRSGAKSKPDASRVRTWTDRSGSFSVEAQFLGMKDGKLNLHKMNGVKIAVPVAKMSLEDLEYVERKTGISLEDDKPLSEVRRRQKKEAESSSRAGASIEPNKKPSYDWFQFFLDCGIQLGFCERYAQAFDKDSMDESVLPDIDASVLRTLGIKEGDIIKVMRFLDQKYGRSKKTGASGDDEGGLFSGPGGTLRNNTGRGRPAPNAPASQTVDANAFNQDKGKEADGKAAPAPAVTSPVTATASGGQTTTSGFDDDAWGIRPSKAESKPEPAPQPAARPEPAPAPAPAPEPVKPPPPSLTGGLADLSLLTQPLQPEKATPPPVVSNAPVLGQPTGASVQAPQQTGATPGFFTSLAMAQQTGAVNGNQAAMARQRPVAPQYTTGQAGLAAPPPVRPLSAPQSAQPSQFTPPPLMPQVTGLVQGQVPPPGQSLNDITQARLQQQYAQQMQMQQQQQPMMTGMMQQPMMTGMMQQPMMTGMQQPGFVQNQFMPQPTGMGMMNGQQQPQMQQSPFADPRGGQFSPVQSQATGFPAPFNPQPQQFAPQPGQPGSGFLPQPLEPQRTAMPAPQQQPLQPQATGHFTQGFGNHGMPPVAQPLVPQQTGPAPPVRFGVPDKKLMPQATGRRANLGAATPQNPFGF